MNLSLKRILLTNIPVKIISIILGYSFWYIISQSHVSDIWLDIPICFYQVPEYIAIEAPEKILVQLSGKRIDLYTIDKDKLAFHINMKHATLGKHLVKLTGQLLFLPENISLIRCHPANICIFNKKKEHVST